MDATFTGQNLADLSDKVNIAMEFTKQAFIDCNVLIEGCQVSLDTERAKFCFARRMFGYTGSTVAALEYEIDKHYDRRRTIGHAKLSISRVKCLLDLNPTSIAVDDFTLKNIKQWQEQGGGCFG